MNKTVLLATAALLAVATTGADAKTFHPATVHHGFAHAHPFVTPNKHNVTLYDQNGNDAGGSIVSSNFQSSFDAYDSQGADDFTVPSDHKWIVKRVNVTGAYVGGAGPADSVTVYFYADNVGLPGDLIATGGGTDFTDTNGSFSIKLEDSVPLRAGTYWVSVQANINTANGEWAWEVNGVQNGNLSAWQNPGDGFGTGCTTWAATESCTGAGPDFMFSLVGKDKLKKK